MSKKSPEEQAREDYDEQISRDIVEDLLKPPVRKQPDDPEERRRYEAEWEKRAGRR